MTMARVWAKTVARAFFCWLPASRRAHYSSLEVIYVDSVKLLQRGLPVMEMTIAVLAEDEGKGAIQNCFLLLQEP
jgi:hypothetical protein